MGVPFQFSRDSFLGKLVARVWEESGNSPQDLEDAFASGLDGEVMITPNAEKQVLMNLLPVQIRKDIEKQNFVLLAEKIEDLVKGNTHITPVPKPDVAFELVEWIFTGFELDDVVRDLLAVIFNKRIVFTEQFILELRKAYLASLEES